MKVTQYIFLALLLLLVSATTALALPANKVLSVQLSTVSPAGQLRQVRTMSVTTDAVGKVDFSFSAVPTSDTAQFLLIRILDGTTILRQSLVVAPAPNGAVNFGVSEVTTSQATAMLKAFADAGNGSPLLAAIITTMVRSGAISTTDLQNLSPVARAAANAFETFLANNGAAGQMGAFQANLLPALRDFAATYKESVDVATIANEVSTSNPAQDLQNKAASNKLEAAKRGDAIARFLNAIVSAGSDAGISPTLMQTAFTEAGKAAEASVSAVSSDVVAAVLAMFRTGAQHCQLRAEMMNYAGALPFMNVAGQPFRNMTTAAGQLQFINMSTATRQQQFTTAMQQFNGAAATLGDAMVTAQEAFEQLFADPGFFPPLQDIGFARDNLSLTLQALLTNFMASTTASPGDILTMQTTMATGMAKVGGIMANMSTTTLQRAGTGSMFTSPGASSQNWLMMMVTAGNFVTPTLRFAYTPSTATFTSLLTVPPFNAPPPPPDFTRFADPYKSLLQLHYDLMLLKFLNQQALAQAPQPITQAVLARIKENDLANRTTVFNSISSSSVSIPQRNALMVTLSQPELH